MAVADSIKVFACFDEIADLDFLEKLEVYFGCYFVMEENFILQLVDLDLEAESEVKVAEQLQIVLNQVLLSSFDMFVVAVD